MFTIIVLILIVALALYAVRILPIDGRLTLMLQLLILVVAIIYLAGML